MSTSDLVRWGGLAALVGGALLVVTDLIGFFALDFENFSETVATGVYAVTPPRRRPREG